MLALVDAPDPALLGQMMKTWEKALLARLGVAAEEEPARAGAANGGSHEKASAAPGQ